MTRAGVTRGSFALVALVALGAANANAQKRVVTNAETLVVGNVERAFELFVPESAPKTSAPLLVVLHGRLGSAKQIREQAGFDEEARRLGIVVAYPDGVDRRWGDFRQLTVKESARKGTRLADDVGFLSALIDTLVARGLVDMERVFLAGHSNGGFMALTFACLRAEKIKGVASVAGGLATAVAGAECALARPVSTIVFHGTDDPLVPFTGGGVGRKGARGFIRSAADTVAVFASAASCAPPVKRAPVDTKPKDGTTLVIEDRARCTVPIAFVIVEDGGHGWPGRKPTFSRATEEIDATRAIAAFFFEGKAP